MLKGRNRSAFIQKAGQKIKKIAAQYQATAYEDLGKYIISFDGDIPSEALADAKKVFGVATIAEGRVCEKIMSDIETCVCRVIEESGAKEGQSFKAKVHRADKSFTPDSMRFAPMVGAMVLRRYGKNLHVDVHQPDYLLHVDIRGKVYVSTKKYDGLGGLPLGSSGKGLLLLSGGIDSPVAGFEMIKRGVKLHYLHFHAHPFTAPQGQDKAVALAQKLTPYNESAKLYTVNLLPVYQAVAEKCKERYMTVLSRRFMMRIAEKLCRQNQYDMMVTGESLGQVASQTIQGITAIEDAVDMPILRPLISRDKTEIIEIAHFLDSYETSILPYDDCCSVFTPSSPSTKPQLKDVREQENLLDVEALISETLKSLEIRKIEE